MAEENEDFLRISTNISIPKLKANDYLYWKFQMEHFMRTRKVLKFVNGESVQPGDDDKRAQEKWKAIDEEVQSLIVNAVEREHINLLFKAKTAKEMWDALKRKFQEESLSNRLELKQKFITLKMEKGVKMDKHIGQLRELMEDLEAVGEDITNEEAILVLFNSLPPEYKLVTFNLKSIPDLNFDQACSRLREAERTFGGESGVESGENALVAAKKRGGDPKPNQPNPKGPNANSKTCYYCKKTGHFASQCRSNPHATKKCNHCGKMGHIAVNCRSKTNGNEGEQRRNNNNNNNNNNNGNNQNREGRSSMLAVSENESAFTTQEANHGDWAVDSGASQHMCNQKSAFTELTNLEDPVFIRVGNGSRVEAKFMGSVELKTQVRDQCKTVVLNNVLFIPELAENLLSVRRAASLGFNFHFGGNSVRVFSPTRELICEGNVRNGLFKLNLVSQRDGEQGMLAQRSTANLWHSRYGHLGAQNLKKLQTKEMVKGLEGIDLTHHSQCEVCAEGKQSQLPTVPDELKTKRKLELVHSDICGPITPTTIMGGRYFVTFMDDYSRKVWVYILKNRSQVLSIFKNFSEMVENQGQEKIQKFLCDNAAEYTSDEFQAFCSSKGIELTHSSPYAPYQNGIAERINRTLVEMVRCMLAESHAELSLWGEALLAAVHLKNRAPHSYLELDKTPEEVWSGHKPSITHLRKWGCKVSVLIPDQFRNSKVGSKVWWGRLVGYGGPRLGYRIWSKEKRRVFIRSGRDCRFFEDVFMTDESDNSEIVESGGDGLEEVMVRYERKEGRVRGELRLREDSSVESGNESERLDNELRESESSEDQESQEIRRSTRERKVPERLTSSKLGELHLAECHLMVEEPKEYKEAIKSENKEKWMEAMNDEIKSIEKNDTWYLCDLPQGFKPLNLKWVYKVKTKANGEIERFKARVVVRGFEQKYGIDYLETFAPVIRKESLRAILAISVELGLQLCQLDVKTAFLNGDLEEEIYVRQPEGFERKGQENKVLRLKKSLYGLKQAPREWNKKVNSVFREYNLRRLDSDPCVYVSGSGDNLLIVGLYVDDLVLAYKNEEKARKLKEDLMNRFEMKDLGKLGYILGMEITYLKDGLKISQQKYLGELLKKFKMENSKIVATPSIQGKESELRRKFQESDEQEEEEVGEESKEDFTYKYRAAVGSLLYLTTCSRPDIVMAVSNVSKFMDGANVYHWQAVKRIFRYLNGTRSRGLIYRKTGNVQVNVFSDSSFCTCADTSRSRGGFIASISGCAVAWSSRLHDVVSLSTAEAEYMQATESAKEILYLNQLLEDIGIDRDRSTLLLDNSSAIQLVKNPIFHKRSKHIKNRFHKIREWLQSGEFEVEYVKTELMAADYLTKGVSVGIFERCLKQIGVE